MRELRVLTLHMDRQTGLFDDRPLRGYLAQREVLAAQPQFFVHDGRPCWTIFLDTRLLQGAAERRPERSGDPDAPADGRKAVREARAEGERAAFATLLAELDEAQRACYERLRSWRHEQAHRLGIPHYVILTNAQALELARRRPRTLAALAEVKGIGAKRVKRHGKAMLEVIHGEASQGRAERGGALRVVDGPDELASGADGEVPQAPAP